MSEIITPVYDEKQSMKVVWLFSGGASSAVYCSKHCSEYNNKSFTNVVAITNKSDASGIEKLENMGLEVIRFPAEKYKSDKGAEWRRFYYDDLLKELLKINPNIIACSGWMLIIDREILKEYENRILNVHPARLSIVYGHDTKWLDLGEFSTIDAEKIIKTNSYRRKYTGADAIFGAICDEQKETCSTIHFIDKGEDSGPILLESKSLQVNEKLYEFQNRLKNNPVGTSEWTYAIRKLREYSNTHQEKQKTECDGPAFHKALQLVSRNVIGFANDKKTIYIKTDMNANWTEMPYGGLSHLHSFEFKINETAKQFLLNDSSSNNKTHGEYLAK